MDAIGCGSNVSDAHILVAKYSHHSFQIFEELKNEIEAYQITNNQHD